MAKGKSLGEVFFGVTLDGTPATKALDGLEKTARASGDGVRGIGDAFTKVGQEGNQAISQVGSAVGGLTGSLSGLRTAIAGGGGILAIGAAAVFVVSSIADLIKSISAFSEETISLEERISAVNTSASDITSLFNIVK